VLGHGPSGWWAGGKWGGGGHCGNGEYRFIASPPSVFLVGRLHEDDGEAANRPR